MPTNAQIQRKHSILKPIAIAILVGYTTFSSMGFAATKASETKASAKQSVASANQGFSSAGLQRIDSFFTDEIAQKRVPGAVVGIMRHGQLVYLKAFGQQNPDTGEPMRTDSIFAVASMTKPMVAVGALTLTQSGKLPLFSRVDSYIPEVKQMKVEIPSASGKTELVEQKQAMRVHDLMRHTSGLTYGGRPDTGGAAAARYPSTGDLPVMSGSKEFVSRVTQLPLVYQPGTTFEYSTSFEMLGAIIEQVTGQRLGAYLKQVIWEPLGMKDTTFQVPENQRQRVAHGFANDPLTGKPQAIHPVNKNPTFDCGGGCAFSTVPDYLRFGQMLLNGGHLQNKVVLGSGMVQLMTSNHLDSSIANRVAVVEPHRAGYGFGLGVAVRTQPGVASVPGNAGEYSWNGSYGTGFFIDPKADLVVVFGTAAPGDLRKYYREQIQDLVYGALTY
jgi:CubicO group peptidase (beta-lactamase class C family)